MAPGLTPVLHPETLHKSTELVPGWFLQPAGLFPQCTFAVSVVPVFVTRA